MRLRPWLLILACLLSPTWAGEQGSADGATEEEPPPKRSDGWREGFSPQFSLHGFTDFTATAWDADPEPPEGSPDSTFALGELDLYVVSQLTRNVSFLGEIVFEFEDDGESRAEVERVFLKYALSDLFWISAGRRHTPLGYWNTAFHHGLLLQPTIERPTIVRFEDHGGILPMHNVGIEAGGTLNRGSWGMAYVGTLANGRGADLLDIQNTSDLNDSKALGLQVSAVREGKTRLEFGANLLIDEIPPDVGAAPPTVSLDETIWGGFLAWRGGRIELLAEYFNVCHEAADTGQEWEHSGYYAIAIWNAWKIKPYVSADRIELEAGDPFFAGVEENERFLVGARWDLHPFLALKFEYRHETPPGVDVDGVAVQVAYTF